MFMMRGKIGQRVKKGERGERERLHKLTMLKKEKKRIGQ